MKRIARVGRYVYFFLALAVFAAAVVALPFVIGTSSDYAMFKGVSVLAASSDRVVISESVVVLSAPKVVLERGTISLPRSPSARPKDKQSIATLLGSGRATFAIEDGVLRVGLHDAPNDMSALALEQSANITPAENAYLAPLAKALKHHQFDRLALRRCTVLITIPGKTPYRLENVHLDIQINKNVDVSFTGSVQYRGQTLQIGTSVGLKALSGAPNRYPIRAKLKNALVDGEINGEITYGARAQILAPRAELKLSSLGAAARWLGTTWPKSAIKDRFEALGALEWTTGAFAFQSATFTLGDNKATGALSLDYRATRPVIEGTLAARKIDLSHYLSDTPDETTLLAMNSSLWLDRFGVGPRSDTLRLLRAIDADIRLSSEAVSISNFKTGHAAASVTLRSGKLLADIAQTELADGGTGNLQFSFDGNGFTPKVGIRGSMVGVDLSAALAWAFGHHVLSGVGNITVDVSGEGLSRHGFLNSLNGTVTGSLPGKSELAIDLESLVSKRFNGGELPGWGSSPAHATPLEDITANLLIKDGVAKIQNLRGAAGNSVLHVSGEIEFPAKAIDLKLSIADRLKGATPHTTPGLGRPVLHATGRWSKPNVMSLDRVDRMPAQEKRGTRNSGDGASESRAPL